MPSSGSGTMIILGPGVPPSTIPGPIPGSCISLVRYAQRIHQNECAFWGVANPAEVEIGYGCDTIWSKWMRDDISYYLAEAQQEIEQQINFPICTRWFTDEQHDLTCPIQTDWGYVIEGGVMALADIADSEAVDYSTDPAVIGPIATTLTDTDEIAIFYPGSLVQIYPETMEITGGFLTIWIPRCRMVAADQLENPVQGWDYNDLDNFTTTVDVKRVYNDPSTQAELIWRNCNTCESQIQDACIYVRNGKIGSVEVRAGTYSADSGWTPTNLFCKPVESVRLNYRAGTAMTWQMEDTIIRLAHSKMPDELCGCETFMRHWRRDRHVPEILTKERYSVPWGLSDGAYTAWRFTQSMKMYRGATL